jgi:hypothetical protein
MPVKETMSMLQVAQNVVVALEIGVFGAFCVVIIGMAGRLIWAWRVQVRESAIGTYGRRNLGLWSGLSAKDRRAAKRAYLGR